MLLTIESTLLPDLPAGHCESQPNRNLHYTDNRDGFIPLGRRTSAAEVNPGKYFTFGDFFDVEADVHDEVPDVFGCICREVLEETGLIIDSSNLVLNGIIYDLVNLHPEMSFIAELDMSSDDIRSSNWQSELDYLTMIKVTEVEKFLGDHRDDFAPALIGGLEVFISKATVI